MAPLTFSIKSIAVQNAIMLLALGAVLSFIGFALTKKSPKHVVISLLWLAGVVLFFNSPLFGFSRVTISYDGIKIDYGILSFRNTTVPITTPWKIESHISGIRRMKKVYTLRLGSHESMRVKSRGDLELLKRIGRAIDEVRKATTASQRLEGIEYGFSTEQRAERYKKGCTRIC